MMEDLVFAEDLARSYQSKGEKTGCWSDYLKAHGLANYCVARDPREERYRLVYEIEDSWYKGKHHLTYSEHKHLTEKHKHLLQDYRDRVTEDFDTLDEEEKLLSSDDIFSQSNMDLLLDFSNKVFGCSKKCSKGLIDVSHEIILSCVEVLGKVGRSAPCEFAVIALGSVAKGEATPYSDLEYAFLVESEDEYFTMLAVDSYFRIGNLGESPLETFDVAELKSARTTIAEIPTVGYRIDGIKEKAGNIPTGRVGGQKLILTVEGFMKLYKTSATLPFNGISGDKSDMLSSSVLIYSSQGDNCPLYKALQQVVNDYESSATREKLVVNRKRLISMSNDIENYNFLPEHVESHRALELGFLIKTHVFRYPTLLANNIRMCMTLCTPSPWEIFSYLETVGLLTKENHSCLLIALALSIYVRTKAYLKLKAQRESVSLYSHYAATKENQYHLPHNLFVIIGCLIIPINRSIRSKLKQTFHSLNQGGDIKKIVGSLAQSIEINTEDFMLKVELLYFVGDYHNALQELSKGVGTSIENISCETFIQRVREKYQTTKSEEFEFKAINICAMVIEESEKYEQAIDYYSWLTTYALSPDTRGMITYHVGQCLRKDGKFKSAKKTLCRAMLIFKQGLGLTKDQDILQNLQKTVENNRDIPDSTSNVYSYVRRTFVMLAGVYSKLGSNNEAIQSLKHSLHIDSLLLHAKLVEQNKPVLFDVESLHTYILSIDMRRQPSKIRCLVNEMSVIHNRLYSAYSDITDLASSLEHAMKQLNILKSLLGDDTNYLDIAICYNNIGYVQLQMGEFRRSLENFVRSEDMFLALNGGHAHSSALVQCYTNFGRVHRAMGDCVAALNCHYKALKMLIALHGDDRNNHVIAQNYICIAMTHYIRGEYQISLVYFVKFFKNRTECIFM